MTSVLKAMAATCPICKQTDHSTFLICKDECDLYKCTQCQHIFVWPIPPIEVLKRLYSFENKYQIQNKAIYDHNTAVSQKTRNSLRQIETFCHHRGRLLDVGCSSGKLLWLAQQHGWLDVYGVELNADTAQIAQDNGLNVFVGELSSANYSPLSFDAIHVGDVIEHVRDPAVTLSEISGFLGPDGIIVLVTPNHDAVFPFLTFWLHRLFDIPWSHVTPPYHLNQFSDKSLMKLLDGLHLNVIYMEYRRCSLCYELGETHVLRSFRGAVQERRPFVIVRRLLFAMFATVLYSVAYCMDRCCVWKKKDFEMLLVANKNNCNQGAKRAECESAGHHSQTLSTGPEALYK